MATTVQQLLDEVTWATGDPPWLGMTMTDSGLAHAARGLKRLTDYGLDAEPGGPRESVVGGLRAACEAAAATLGPAPASPVSDRMGAASDIVGRSAPQLGRGERWAISIEFAAAADQCAKFAQREPGGRGLDELNEVRLRAAAVERAAAANPPTQLARASLDRLVPISDLPAAQTGVHAAAEAAAALVTAITRADDRGGLTLRELRMVTASAQISSQYVAAVAAALPGGDEGEPGRSAAAAWHVARDATADFDDHRWTRRTEQSEVTAAALRVQSALSDEFGPVTSPVTSGLSGRRALPEFLAQLQLVANQNPVIAEQLTAVTRTWAQNGTLSAQVDLIHMENMPTPWVEAHLEGRSVRAWQGNLDIITAALDRAGTLSTGVAAELDQLAAGRPPAQPHLLDLYASRVATPASGEQLLAAAHKTEQALTATRTPFRATTTHRPDGPSPSR